MKNVKIAGETQFPNGNFRDHRRKPADSIWKKYPKAALIVLTIILLGLLAEVAIAFDPGDDTETDTIEETVEL
jgi:hypothetical protein